jgi:Flp pilus assembly protein TadD
VIAAAIIIVVLAIVIPMVLISGEDVENPHSDEELERLSAQMALDYTHQKAAYEDLLEANPSDDVALSGLGQISMREEDFATAVTFFTRAIEINPAVAQYHELLGEAYYEMNLLDKSVASMDQAVALEPDDQLILINAGIVIQQVGGREEEARQLWQRAYDLDPESDFGQNAFHLLYPEEAEEAATTENPHQ